MNFRNLLLTTTLLAVGAAFLSGQPVYQLPPFDVRSDEWQRDLFDGEYGTLWLESESGMALSLANQLESIAGLTMQRRGFGSMEPNLRGFTMDRITTTFNGLYLPIAAPTHTASPVNFLGPLGAGHVIVISGFPSVTLGPVPVGGRISVESYQDQPVGESIKFSGFTNPAGWIGQAVFNPSKGIPGIDSVMAVYSSQASYFVSGDNIAQVDEKYAAWGLLASMGAHPFEDSSFNFAVNYQSQDEANNPSLPLDSNGSETVFVTAEWIQETSSGELLIEAGIADINHNLSSRKRPVSPESFIRLIDAETDAGSISSKIEYSVYLMDKVKLRAGSDYIHQEKDALRNRHLKSGTVLADRIWPDISTEHIGAYLELAGEWPNVMKWRLGARMDNNKMNAGKVDAAVAGVPGSIGDTILDNFSAYQGAGINDIRKEFRTGSVQVVLEKKLNNAFSLVAGADYTVAPPGPGESYRAFLNALGGGVELGNPLLDAERKQGLSLGIQYRNDHIRVSSEAWYADINDFITRDILKSSPLVYSYTNEDSEFRGIDVVILFGPYEIQGFESFTCELTYSRTIGQESGSSLSLADVPPWESTFKLMWNERGRDSRLSGALALKYVAKKNNPQPGVNPVYRDTNSFLTVDFMLSFKVFVNATIHLGVSNVFDELCYAYLQPPVSTGPVLPSGGNLSGGDLIPLPGRSLFGSFSWRF